MKNENLTRALRLLEEAAHKAEMEGVEVEEWVYALEVRALVNFADVEHLRPIKFLIDKMLEDAIANVKERKQP